MSLLLLVATLMAADTTAATAAAPQVAFETSKGTIVVELDAAKAPKTVANFLEYVRAGHYDGLVFHRVIPKFMIQTGGFKPDMSSKPLRPPIQNEADNGLKNKRGTLAMARTGDPHSASAQFFINVVDNAFLDHKGKTPDGWGYAVFGKVVDGMDVVDAIAAVPTAQRGQFSDVPTTPILITKASVK